MQREGRIELKKNPYTHPRAFTVNPTPEDLALLEELLALTWRDSGDRHLGGAGHLSRITVLDPFAGGGSIPFEARRYGFATIANELNPVAADIRKWGCEWSRRVEKKLVSFTVPRTRVKGKFVRPEADLLERLRAAFFEELEVPAEEKPPQRIEQMRLM